MNMNSSNRKIKSTIEFIVFTMIILFLFCKITWIFRASTTQSREDLAGFKNQGKIDVVLCGGSTLLRGYQPLEAYQKKGFTSYNYVVTFEKGNLLKAFIEESRSTNKAILYVCDLRAIPLLTDDIEEVSLRNWSDAVPIFSPARIKGISSFLFSRNWRQSDIFSYYLDIAKYHSVYNMPADPYQWSYVNTSKIYNMDKGYTAVTDHIPFDTPNPIDECGKLTERQSNRLNELLDYCDKEKLQVLFIVSPYVISEPDWKTLNTCGNIIQDRGYDFINFNNYYDEIGINYETDFYDSGHLNYLGSEKFTNCLMNYISAHYELPDHRGEEEYEIWNHDYAEFSLLQEDWKECNSLIVEEHLKAKETGQKLRSINDFSDWFELIQNENFTIITVKNQCESYDTDDWAFRMMLYKWEIDLTQSNYIGIRKGENNLFITDKENIYEGAIGINNDRYTIPCFISIGENPSISINGINYYNNLEGIQLVVIDNNYQTVVDNINVYIEENKVKLIHSSI